MIVRILLVALAATLPWPLAGQDARDIASMREEIRSIYDGYRVSSHVPGSVYGVIKDGHVILIDGLGTRDPNTGAAVDGGTRFRIASMSKAFTALAILHLRERGKIALDAPASRYVPEMAAWKLPTSDSRPITVADLLHHSAGLVEDNPWGDRQQVLTEAEFTALIASGMDFASAPGSPMEYSNYGYALLGRIISNVTGQRYQDYIRQTIMLPLGMNATSYDVFASPPESRALGFRWQDDAWLREPDMRDGAFGAMGGVETTANDYARWMLFLLSAWPASDGPESGPVKRSTVRDLVALQSYMPAVDRAEELGPTCRQGIGYAAGLRVVSDCELGRVLNHSGGYPGYGSHMILLPEAGAGLFVFSNRTYATLSLANWHAALVLRRAGAIPNRDVAVSRALGEAYALAKRAWDNATIADLPLANNVAADRDLPRRARELSALKDDVGACSMNEPIVPISAMEGTFQWSCANGRVAGRIQRAPSAALQFQVIDFEAVLAD